MQTVVVFTFQDVVACLLAGSFVLYWTILLGWAWWQTRKQRKKK